MANPVQTLWRKIPDVHPAALLVFFVAADGLAALLHGFHEQGLLPSRFFHIARDRGFGEIVQYLKFAAMIAVLARWRLRWPSRLATAWLILIAVMLVDDAVGIHEEVGGWLLSDPGARFHGLRLKDLAEAIAFAALEGSAFLWIAVCHLRETPERRGFSWWFAAALAPVVFCGLVLDVVRAPMVESAGEMISMTLLLAAVLWQYRRRPAA